MAEIIKLILPFLSTPTNYADVLRQLAGFAFWETYIITLSLRANSHFDNFLNVVESWGPIGRALAAVPYHDAVNLSGFAIGLIVALLTRAFRFHDRISDLLGIRRRFDVKSILVPLARRLNSAVDENKKADIAENRDELMRTVFYKYASSRADKPLVDKHEIEQALVTWFLFWVFVEGVAYFGIGAVYRVVVGFI